jgi:hypothetical protein
VPLSEEELGALKRVVIERLAIPDLHLGQTPATARAAIRLARSRAAAVVMSSPYPESSHLALAMNLVTGLRWVAESRDGWLFDSLKDLYRHRVRRRIEASLERKVARHAALLRVTRAIARDFEGRFGRSWWIPNGFDDREVSEWAVSEARRVLDPSAFNLVYTGQL